jgi:hypothetical protein
VPLSHVAVWAVLSEWDVPGRMRRVRDWCQRRVRERIVCDRPRLPWITRRELLSLL